MDECPFSRPIHLIVALRSTFSLFQSTRSPTRLLSRRDGSETLQYPQIKKGLQTRKSMVHQQNKKSKSEILGNECDAEVLACVTNALLQEPSGLTDFSLELTTTTLYKVEGEAPRPRILVWIHCGVKTTDHRSKDPVKVHYLLRI